MIVLAILLDGFYAASIGGDGPLVVHREKKALDVNSEARARGVEVGMPLSEARSILAADGKFIQWEEEPYRESQRLWLEVVAEYADVVEPLKQHEALADLSGHPRPRDAAERLREALVSLGSNPSLGLAPCRWVARLAARRGDPLGLAHADPASYVRNAPVSLLPIPPDVAQRLTLYGYRTAGETAALGLDSLRRQFGDWGHTIAQAAVGRGDANVKAAFPECAIASRHVYDGSPDTRQELDAGLDSIAREIGAALRDRDFAGRKVELFLEGEDASVKKISRTFASSITREHDVSVALRLMLPHAPEARIESVRARLPELRSTRRVQLDIQGGRSKADDAESVRAALEHVRGTFGDGSVRLVADIKASRREMVRRAYRELNGWPWR